MFRVQPHSRSTSNLVERLACQQRYSAMEFSTRPGAGRAYITMLGDIVTGTPKDNDVERANFNFLNIAFFANKHNSLSQRLALELEKRHHTVKVFEIDDANSMSEIAIACQPDIILAPFLTKRVPEDVFTHPTVPCVIVHPGIAGDRGRHSLDWALHSQQTEWGVTLLQAAEEMDAGDICSTSNFQINRANVNTLTKSSLYTNEVTESAVRCTLDTIDRFQKRLSPRPLDYNDINVKGTFNPPLKKVDRTVDWKLSAEEVAARVRMSDSSPGVIATLLVKDPESDKMLEETFRVFGAHLESNSYDVRSIDPGHVIAQRNGAILVQCGDGAVWLSHLKKNKLKLPAVTWLKNRKFIPRLAEPHLQLTRGTYPSTFQEIWTWLTPEGVCYVHFNFYNGAMNTDQCQRLSSALREISKNDACKVVVLMGGHNFFSNGIHLNCIQNSQNPAVESLHNINAMQDKLTISALQGNAGAGGVMMALASDLVFSRDGIVLNPHYTGMGLFGSEYHTYFLNDRLGEEIAMKMTSGTKSILSSEAASIGLFDGVMGSGVVEFQEEVESIAREIALNPSLQDVVGKKLSTRGIAWNGTVESCRQLEIRNMINNFQSEEYDKARKDFVLH